MSRATFWLESAAEENQGKPRKLVLSSPCPLNLHPIIAITTKHNVIMTVINSGNQRRINRYHAGCVTTGAAVTEVTITCDSSHLSLPPSRTVTNNVNERRGDMAGNIAGR